MFPPTYPHTPSLTHIHTHPAAAPFAIPGCSLLRLVGANWQITVPPPSEEGASWHLQQVVLIDKVGQTWTFTVDRWFDKKALDGQLEAEFPVQVVAEAPRIMMAAEPEEPDPVRAEAASRVC